MLKRDLAILNITVLPDLCSHFLNELSCGDDVITDENEYEYKLSIALTPFLHDDLHGGLLRGDILHGVLGDQRALLDTDTMDTCAIPGQSIYALDGYALQSFQPDAP